VGCEVPRTSPDFTDDDNTYLLPPSPELTFSPTDLMCKRSQSIGNQTGGPVLTASDGDRIALRYLENGHITQPDVPPNKFSSGNVTVYGTFTPLEDDRFLDIHGQWTLDGLGGDQRGFILSAGAFDDGGCFQFDPTHHSPIANQRYATFGPGTSANEAPNRWCGSMIILKDPSGEPLSPGTVLTLYWVWDWPSYVAGNAGAPPTVLNETYTSCMDIFIA
jgi:hypothetical protein